MRQCAGGFKRRARGRPGVPIGRMGAVLLAWAAQGPACADQRVITGPPGSEGFGEQVLVLPNGNILVADSRYDGPGGDVDVGAIWLFGPDAQPISELTGSTAGDRVGIGAIIVLANGNVVACSPLWDDGVAADVGAATWISGSRGLSGTVSVLNSLVGEHDNDQVCNSRPTVLANGNYVVRSPFWDRGPVADAGATTFGNGSTGVAGRVSLENSLVGGRANDLVGGGEVVALRNGNYVVLSADWDNGAFVDAGAVTLGSGATGTSGVVSTTNSLVGGGTGNGVGSDGLVELANGNFVVRSENWDNGTATDAGAVTFVSAASGLVGVVSAQNSLVGSRQNDFVGLVYPLANGNYVVASSFWDNGSQVNVGAVTLGSGSAGVSGVVSSANSMIGSTALDAVGSDVIVLANGNYVVLSPAWDDGSTADVGAATFFAGSTAPTGTISGTNSMVGSRAGDFVGSGGGAALAGGNVVVASPGWDNGTLANVGAATFVDGSFGAVGPLSPARSLIGASAGDTVGRSVTALGSGHYVVSSPDWDNGALQNAGAATFGRGDTGITGLVSPANSLVGTQANQRVGSHRAVALRNGDYVVHSQEWDDGPALNVGAVTYGSGLNGIMGPVSAGNSLVGSAAGDAIGGNALRVLADGFYAVLSPIWNAGALADAGAITLGLPGGGTIGTLTVDNSVIGLVSVPSPPAVLGGVDGLRRQMAVGQPASRRVVLHRAGLATDVVVVTHSPDPSGTGTPVAFGATVAASAAPTDGSLRFMADTGESCIDTSASPIAAGNASRFECNLVFDSAGPRTVIAEYFGSLAFAYDASAAVSHVVIAGDGIFSHGFESSEAGGSAQSSVTPSMR